jgi:hypothetical protein
MQIASSSVELSSTRVSFSSTTRQESLKTWVGDEPPDRLEAKAGRPGLAPPPVVEVADRLLEEEGRTKGTPQDELDLLILRKTFRLARALSRGASEIRSAYADPGPGRQAAQATEASRGAAPAQAEPPAREGWGLRYDLTETSLRYESTSFAASAKVTTADGRTIQLEAALAMERTEVRSREVHLRAGDAAKVDPLVLNLQGGAAAFDGVTAFDLDADGAQETVAALSPGSAYLALDRNGNGKIDSGAELFGPTTGSGFGELAALDADGNGWVDEGDPAFKSLKLWNPTTGALSPLAAASVGALYTGAAATPFDLRSAGGALQGTVAATGLFLREDGRAGTMQHVDLVA